MAMTGDAEALEAGTDNSALGAVGWALVKVDRVLRHGDTVSLGGNTLRAVHSSGHTQGATTWVMTVTEQGRHDQDPHLSQSRAGARRVPRGSPTGDVRGECGPYHPRRDARLATERRVVDAADP